MRDRAGAHLLLLVVLLSCLLLSACRGARTEEAPGLPTQEQLSEEIAGYAEVLFDFDQVRAIVVAQGDEIVFEEYYGTDETAYWGMQSVTKSVVSTLVGIAIDEGLIGGVDDTLAELLPDQVDAMSPETAGITLRQLLTMTAGFPDTFSTAALPEFLRAKDWVRAIVSTPASPPGGDFAYSDGTSHLLAAIVQKATDGSVYDYARTKLFEPLGIDAEPALVDLTWGDATAYYEADFAWPQDPQGISVGYSSLKLRPRDMVKIGQLFLAGGEWEGEQLVSEEWVDEATSAQVEAEILGDGYGYQWWTATVDGSEAFRAMGYGGEVIQVIPDRDLVVVAATEVRLDDATSHGIDNSVLLGILEDGVVAQFPDA